MDIDIKMGKQSYQTIIHIMKILEKKTNQELNIEWIYNEQNETKKN